jgi:anti-sigma B factor antagonist
MRHLELDTRVRGSTAEVALSGELDMAAAFKLEPAIDQVVSENAVDEVVLDLAGVSFMDSAGLGSLLSTQERLNDLGIGAELRSPSDAAQRVLAANGIDPA